MKRLSTLLLCGLAGIASVAMQSCVDTDDDNGYYVNHPNALVTVKPTADNTDFYLQLDDKTTLDPINISTSPFGEKEVRALVNYSLADKTTNTNYTYAVNINWIDSILTKNMATNLAEQNIEKYGKDQVEIVNDWVSIAEDGYLTLRFRTRWGGEAKHMVSLVNTGTETEPYKVTFFHHANGDTDGAMGDGIVAFRLTDLPDTNGATVKLTLVWESYSGTKSTEFDYCTRQANTSDAVSESTNYHVQYME